MPRSREFEPTAALEQVMLFFWQKGYQATSIADLVKETGVSRYGLYSVFGDKNDLFIKSIDLYYGTAIQHMVNPMEADDAGLLTIMQYFERLLSPFALGEPAHGCLIGNTALALSDPPPGVAERIQIYFQRLHAAFENAASNGVAFGEITMQKKPNELASYLVGVVQGYLGMLRIGSSPNDICEFVNTAIKQLE